MHTPSPALRVWLLPIAALGLGCSSTGGFGRRANDPSVRTVASIGDRPVTTVSGSPTSSAVADLEDHKAAPDRTTRVSGRVVDDRGDPVAGARVRIADGGISGGRVIESTSDRAGGFTLRGLRPGSKYTLIAEYEGQGGWIEGRTEVRTPATGVEIAVRADELPADRRRANREPAGRKISERRPVEEDGPIPSRVNDDDVPEGSDDDDRTSQVRPVERTKAVAVSGSGSGWRPSRVKPEGSAMTASAVSDRATHRASTRTLDEETRTEEADVDARGRDSSRDEDGVQADEADADEDNPLPPAIDRATKPKRGRGDDPGRDPDPSAARPRSTRRVSQVETERPGTNPGALTLAKEETPPRRAAERPAPADDAPDRTPPRRAQPRPAPAPEPEAEAAAAAYNPFPPPKKPVTWSDLSGAWDVDREDRRANDAAPADFEPRRAPERRPALAIASERPRVAPARSGGAIVETCRYDAQRRQILDFRLPDLDGRPISLADFDADFLLLDFWGTWCRPCLTSVPHLVELQKRIGSSSLAVVGIACEEGPATSNTAHVADVAKGLGINYTILLSSKDDSASPMQEALHIQAFPTMILIDRSGRVVWRDQGATTTTLARLDRILASSTKAAHPDAARR